MPNVNVSAHSILQSRARQFSLNKARLCPFLQIGKCSNCSGRAKLFCISGWRDILPICVSYGRIMGKVKGCETC